MGNKKEPRSPQVANRDIGDAAIRETRGKYAVDLEARRMWFRASTDRLCPDGKVILPGAWKKGMRQYMKNPVFLDTHKYDSVVDRVLGKTVAWEIDDSGLLLQVEFAETSRGQAAWYLYSEGYANAVSVGWDTLKSAPKKDEATEREYEEISEAQLLELSGCPIGADSEALAKHANPLVEVATRVLGWAEGTLVQESDRAESESESEVDAPTETEVFCTSLLSEMRELRAVAAALLVRMAELREARVIEIPAAVAKEPDPVLERLRRVADCVTLTDEQIKERLVAGLRTE